MATNIKISYACSQCQTSWVAYWDQQTNLWTIGDHHCPHCDGYGVEIGRRMLQAA